MVSVSCSWWECYDSPSEMEAKAAIPSMQNTGLEVLGRSRWEPGE